MKKSVTYIHFYIDVSANTGKCFMVNVLFGRERFWDRELSHTKNPLTVSMFGGIHHLKRPGAF